MKLTDEMTNLILERYKKEYSHLYCGCTSSVKDDFFKFCFWAETWEEELEAIEILPFEDKDIILSLGEIVEDCGEIYREITCWSNHFEADDGSVIIDYPDFPKLYRWSEGWVRTSRAYISMGEIVDEKYEKEMNCVQPELEDALELGNAGIILIDLWMYEAGDYAGELLILGKYHVAMKIVNDCVNGYGKTISYKANNLKDCLAWVQKWKYVLGNP